MTPTSICPPSHSHIFSKDNRMWLLHVLMSFTGSSLLSKYGSNCLSWHTMISLYLALPFKALASSWIALHILSPGCRLDYPPSWITSHLLQTQRSNTGSSLKLFFEILQGKLLYFLTKLKSTFFRMAMEELYRRYSGPLLKILTYTFKPLLLGDHSQLITTDTTMWSLVSDGHLWLSL